MVKTLPAGQETQVPSLGEGDTLEKRLAALSSSLAWRINGQGALRAAVHGVAKRWTQLSD